MEAEIDCGLQSNVVLEHFAHPKQI
jgi:hypothetical protein